MLGWVVTFICYPPVIYSVFTAWLDYKVNLEHSLMEPWLQILGSLPTLLISVGVMIILLELVHLWGEALLGLRSSNLMNRGIVTNGPFAYTKHPIYVVKCIGWFLVYLPFINPSDFLSAFQSTILLLGVCYVFLARGWAEERLLASDEVYVAYARYIDKQGVFAWLGRLLPILSFTWRYEYWERKGLLKL
jgi:protein-S-isoprenylcysteine O-methyltransferase Ste14